jgi:hypothetical protein
LLDLDGIRNAVARAGQRNDASFSLSGSTPTTLRVCPESLCRIA